MNNAAHNTEEIYLAGGCLWGVQEFVRHLPGVIKTEAGSANGTTNSTHSEYDGYAECVRTVFEPAQVSVSNLVEYLFEIIDPYINQQGPDIGEKYHRCVQQNRSPSERSQTMDRIRNDADRIAVEVLPLSNYIPSDPEHQDRLTRCPEDACHLPKELLYKYK